MSVLKSMTSGIPGGATKPATPVQTQVNNSDPYDVSDEVASITSQNSLAMRSAAAKGERAAASRNMQNSTIGAQAAQRAMLDAALPMAQQNVSQRHNKRMQDDQQAWQSSENKAQRDWQSSESSLGRGHDIKMQEDSVRANTVGEYLNSARELQTSFFDAYKDIQSSEIPAEQKSAAIQDLYAKQQQQLDQLKKLYGGLATTEKDWSDFADLLN